MNNNDKSLAESIRRAYLPKETTSLDELRALDAKVKRPASILAYVLGSIAAVIMGTGMSLVMTDLPKTLGMGDGLVPGILIGIVGLALALVNYPLYRSILTHRKKIYAKSILALSDSILQK